MYNSRHKNPLLVSCRSGAKFSMPGMMDTVLNIGLNDDTAEGMIQLTGDNRFVYDAYRRLIQMFGSVLMNLPDEAVVGALMEIAVGKSRGVNPDLECGICGEHGGDPISIGLCHRMGLSYVSCSPFRVPAARLAAAHATLREDRQ